MTDHDPDDDIVTDILPPGDKTPELLRQARARLARLEPPRFCPDCACGPCRCHELDHMPGRS